MKEISSYRLLGVKVHALTIPVLHNIIGNAISNGQRYIIISQNLNGVYHYHHDPKMQALHSQAHIRIDGMFFVILGRLLGLPLRRENRVAWLDWIYPFMEEAAKNSWRVFYLSSKPGVAERGAEVLRNRFTGLQIVTSHGYFDVSPNSLENNEVLKQINDYRPDILIVGMGMPRQEHWILDNMDRVHVNVILSSGACIDYVAGIIPTPPRWTGQLGLEWLYRLLSEPRRLWRRYLWESRFIVGLFLKDLWLRYFLRKRL